MRKINFAILALVCILLLSLSGVLFYYQYIKLPRVAQETEAQVRLEVDLAAMPKQVVWVVSHPEGISKYTELTPQYIESHLEQIEIPVQFLVKDALTSLDAVQGMISKDRLNPGQQLVLNQFYTDEDWYGPEERLKEYPVTSLVAEEVKTGNLVDVQVHYGDGDYDVVVAKMKVRKIVMPEVDQQDYKQEEKPYVIILSVNETQYRDLTLAAQLGDLETRLYHDTDQPASQVSFDYEKGLKQVRLIHEANEKPGVAEMIEILPNHDAISYNPDGD